MYVQMQVIIIKDLILDFILGNDLLNKYRVMKDYSAHEIFLGKDNRIRVD